MSTYNEFTEGFVFHQAALDPLGTKESHRGKNKNAKNDYQYCWVKCTTR